MKGPDAYEVVTSQRLKYMVVKSAWSSPDKSCIVSSKVSAPHSNFTVVPSNSPGCVSMPSKNLENR